MSQLNATNSVHEQWSLVVSLLFIHIFHWNECMWPSVDRIVCLQFLDHMHLFTQHVFAPRKLWWLWYSTWWPSLTLPIKLRLALGGCRGVSAGVLLTSSNLSKKCDHLTARWGPYCWWFRNPEQVEVGSLSHYLLRFFFDPKWLFGISSINSTS